MYENGGFEGNAQTLRILSVLEKKQKKSFPLESTDDVIIKELYGIGNDGEDLRVGLNLTYRTLASILKYDKEISSPTPHALTDNGNKIITKGYYSSSKNLVNQIKENVLIDPQNTEFFKKNTFKTIECQIMDIADDIAYSTYDLEDCLKGKFITLRDLNVSNRTLTRITEKVANNLSKSNVKISTEEVNNILYQVSSENIISASKYAYNTAKQKDNLSEDDYTRMGYDISAGSYLADKTLQENGYLRTQYTSSIVNDAVNSISFEYNIDEPAISKITIEENQRKKIEVLKQFNYVITIESSKLKIIEHRGKEIVESIFMTLADDPMLLPDDWYVLYTLMPCNQMKKRVICDFIAGMTDRYALEFYCRFHSVSPESIFKPF
jgi:dGTPase